MSRFDDNDLKVVGVSVSWFEQWLLGIKEIVVTDIITTVARAKADLGGDHGEGHCFAEGITIKVDINI